MRAIVVAITLTAVLGEASPALACSHPDNAVANCGFTSSLDGWTGGPGTITRDPSDGSSQPGSLQAAAGGSASPFAAFEQCVTGVAGGASYGFGIDARRISGGAVSCTLLVDQYAGASCTPPALGAVSVGISLASGWTQSSSTHVTNASAHSVIFTVSCLDAAQAFTLRFDDAFYGPGLVPVELQSLSIE